MFEILVIGWAAFLGLLIGGAMARGISRRLLQQAREEAERVVGEAREAARLARRQAEALAREEALQLRRSRDELERQVADENALLDERLAKLEARNEKREAEQAVREAELARREAALLEAKAAANALKLEAKETCRAQRALLESKAGKTAEEVRGQLTEAIVEEARALCADRLRNLENAEGDEFVRQAKRMIGISIGRYSGHFLVERMSSTMPLPPGAAEKLARSSDGGVSLLPLIEEQSGVHLAIAETGESLRLEGGDGVGRELARRILTRVLGEGGARDPVRLIKSISADLEREIREKGLEGFRFLGLRPAHPELVRLVGRLNFRTSYTQNQWEHTVEAAMLAGLMAAELGLDVTLARRGTLLHDVGKALSHELEGSHAVIGAELAGRYGEDALVVNAIGSHHGDEPPRSPYAHIVAAADALSGARPGARREMVETFVDRVADLQRIANTFPGVVGVHAMQAGRELRVQVDEHRVDDERAKTLAEDIARKVSAELVFPGQIRVTVIRELKAVELAS